MKISEYMREQGFDNFKMEYLESVPKKYGPRAEGMWYLTFKDLGFDMKNKLTPGNGDNVRGTICYENYLASQREKIPCELCGKMICRGGIRKHQRRSNCI
jgi:hypothetical protein